MKYFEIDMYEHLEKVVEEGRVVVVNASPSSILWRKKKEEKRNVLYSNIS